MSEVTRETNGFRVRGLNADVDRLAVQSTHQTTFWPFQKRRWSFGNRGWQEIGLQRNELIVMRSYGAAPEIEIEALGDRFGVLVVEATQQFTRTLRVGSRLRIAMKEGESIVVKNEFFKEPRVEGTINGRV